VRFSTEDRIAVVGAGAMGGPLVRHLVRAGFPVTACDRGAQRRDRAEAAGARAVSTVDDLGDCRAALVTVPTDDDVTLVAGQYAAVAPEAAVLVVHSSVRTETCRAVEQALRPRGVRVVDAALTGGVRGAEGGQINLLVGGAAADVADLEPVFAPYTSHVNHLGPLGAGQVGKTVGNLLHWAEIVACAEALSLGAELGVPAAVLRPALQNGGTDSRTLRELQEMRFTWYEKDIDNAIAMAATVDRELVLSQLVQRLMREIDVPAMAALLAGRGTIALTGTRETPAAP
jgi:3-hydroxyisobutyrate dehydrogenase-like beta-hydroxyacid dehydrogenase